MSTRFIKSFHVWQLLFVALWLSAAAPARAQTSQDDFAIAANHYSLGNWNESVAAFHELIDRHPESAEATSAKFYLAEVMMQRGEFGQAYRAFQIFLRENPVHEYAQRAMFRMGESAFRMGNYDVAIRLLEEFVKTNPHDGLTEFALPYLGEMRLSQEEPQLAQRAFETALKMYPMSAISNTSRLGLAKALQMTGNEEEATRFYQFLLTQDCDELIGESHLQLGIVCYRRSDFEAAEDHLREAISKCQSVTSQSEATYWLARTHNETNDFERAVELLKTIVDVKLPEKLAVAAWFDGAVAAAKTGKEDLALRWLARLRETYPKNPMVDESIQMAIDLHQRRGESDQALVLIRQFREEHSNSPMRASVLEAEGRSHYAGQRYKLVIETFEVLLSESEGSASKQQADRANWHYLKSLGHLGLGDFEQAELELASIDTLTTTEQLRPLVKLARATARYGMEDFAMAIENYRGYLEMSASGAEQNRARAELTICLAETGRWDEAAIAFSELAADCGDDPLVLSTARFLAQRSYHEKQIAHAERWFTLLAKPGNPQEAIAQGLSGLAWIKMEIRDSQSVNDVFERLFSEFPQSEFSGDIALARAKFFEDEKEFQQAAQTYGIVIRQFGTMPIAGVARLRRAHALQKLGGPTNLEEAKTLLEEYLKMPSGNPLADEALYQLGWVFHDLGQPEECLLKFAELVEGEPESRYWSDAAYRLVQNAVSQHDLESAKRLIAKILARTDVPIPVVSRVLMVQGQIAATENEWSAVTNSMSELLKRTDDETTKNRAEYWLAESFFRQKQYAEGLEIFRRLVTVVQQLDVKLEPWIHLRMAQCQGYEGDWSGAVEIVTDAKTRFPDFEAGYEYDFVLGRGLEDSGRLMDARDAYERVIKSARGGATETAAIAQWRIGETYFHQEDYVNAIKSYHKVDSLFTYPHWRSASLFQAGKCQEHLRNDKHAIKLYTQLIESFPDSEFAAGARERLNRLTAQAQVVGPKTMDQENPSRSRR